MLKTTKNTKTIRIYKGLFLSLCVLLLCVLVVIQPASANPPPQSLNAEIITAGNGWSSFPTISADGRWVAFASDGSNLVSGDTNQTADIFVYDRQTELTERVSVSSEGQEANAISTRPAISADGRFVAFESLADNLVPGDTNFLSDIFVHDRLTGQTIRVSVDVNGHEGNGWSEQASISADGHYIAFLSAADNLMPNDTNGVRDAFLHNRLSGYTMRASISSDGGQADGETSAAVVTPSNRTVVFVSQASNLTTDNNPGSSIFALNRLLPRTVQIPGTGQSVGPDTSTGGQWIAYRLPEQAQTAQNVYIYDQLNESTYTARFPVALRQHDLSDDGQHIATIGSADNGTTFNLYYHALESAETDLLIEGVSDARPAISADGSAIAYVKDINGITQIFVLDRRLNPEPTYFVSGRITSPLGNPLGVVEIEDNRGNTAVTDERGYFFFSGITPGNLNLTPSKPGFNFEPGGLSFMVESDLEEKNFHYVYDELLTEARKDIGMPYDHRCDSGPECEGVFHGYAAGQCTDLVLDAFAWGCDYSIRLALTLDGLSHREHFYQNRNARDAFDMWRYFMYSGQMLSHEQPYQVGDMVFFDWSGDGEIDHVSLVSQVDGNNQPAWMVDATGVIASNPKGLAAELPWEPFHERSERGHARWDGTYESAVMEQPQGQSLQVGLGSVGADLFLISEGGNRLSGMENTLPGGFFFDLIWEQNLTVLDPLEEAASPSGEGRYYIVISNPTEEGMPYYFVVQTVQDGSVTLVEKFTGTLDPGRVRYLPLKLSFRDGSLGFELISVTRKSGGQILK